MNKAVALFVEAEGIYRSVLGSDHVTVAGACDLCAVCKEKVGDKEGALVFAREAHQIFSKLGPLHAVMASRNAEMVRKLSGDV